MFLQDRSQEAAGACQSQTPVTHRLLSSVPFPDVDGRCPRNGVFVKDNRQQLSLLQTIRNEAIRRISTHYEANLYVFLATDQMSQDAWTQLFPDIVSSNSNLVRRYCFRLDS
jgi:hypothetical protein